MRSWTLDLFHRHTSSTESLMTQVRVSAAGPLSKMNISSASVPRPDRRRIGIALAAYKPDRTYFFEQLRSIQEQSLTTWICVVSFDSENELASQPEFTRFFNDNRFIWVRNPSAPGVRSNFQFATKFLLDLKIDVIAFSDQDDIWYPKKLELLYNELCQCKPLSIVHSDMHLFRESLSEKNEPLMTGWAYEKRNIANTFPLAMLLRNVVTGAACMFDSDLARRFPTISSNIDFHDHWFALLASLLGEIKSVSTPLYAYRQHESNVLGAQPFKSILSIPKGRKFFEGFSLAKKSWAKSLRLISDLDRAGAFRSMDIKFLQRLLAADFFSRIQFLILSFMYVFNDPPLARVLLFKGTGRFLSPGRVAGD